ncbi:transmembrane protein, putative (macronuclear) [Tetrahymena thermophila SB210]|uniref:Transmembrane protein, putative n=1 Tax=Tetrahymena thermophila (strain SB210) TaxID=312017 RepID=W7XDT4_TETTS|nr:transmembrane protein, putative [Tetrahymena thermophila SB210]EWS75757.1 transmembrane protein, putative [Tetrahymena thermophila SB210]|eukprot:XP_012651679.1 transmembrane protein, putative [Tetrahymena thermophila SB210]
MYIQNEITQINITHNFILLFQKVFIKLILFIHFFIISYFKYILNKQQIIPQNPIKEKECVARQEVRVLKFQGELLKNLLLKNLLKQELSQYLQQILNEFRFLKRRRQTKMRKMKKKLEVSKNKSM